MKIAYLDCFAGVSGDMLLGSLVDAGLPAEDLHDLPDILKIDGIKFHIERVQKGAFSAVKVNINYSDSQTKRNLRDILGLVEKSDLPETIKLKSSQVFTRIAEAEAHIHQKDIHEVHLHELGGIDTLADVTGVLWGFKQLSIQQLICSPLPLGHGMQNSAHGLIPIPAPATLKLLETSPVYGKGIDAELVTPTGAALVTTLADGFGPVPGIWLESIGYGAGERDHDFPNVLRLLIGNTAPSDNINIEGLCLIETNIDDLNPEIYEYLMDELLAQGSLDVYLTSIHMKKNRPGIKLNVLCRIEDFDRLSAVVFRETTTTGLRRIEVNRYSLPRSSFKVSLPYGIVQIKSITTSDGNQKLSPEYEDCKRIAKAQGIPILEVYRAAQKAAEEIHI